MSILRTRFFRAKSHPLSMPRWTSLRIASVRLNSVRCRPMTNFNSENSGEFDLIAKYFAPLARSTPGAFGLTDDAATISVPPGDEIVITADLLSAGVHFLADDLPVLIAKKALRVNLSDLAAKGAAAHGYLLSLALPRNLGGAWFEEFARGLREDQAEFGLSLLGGDTTATDGPLTVAITALGLLPKGTMIRRNGARPGDLVFVSGTIGDSRAGLSILKGEICDGAEHHRTQLVARYQKPAPRLGLGLRLRGLASAALDVSDGLLGDLAHVAEMSGVRICVEAERIPLSDALRICAGVTQSTVLRAATAGDDYEIAFTAPPDRREPILRAAADTATAVSEIGRVEAGAGVVLLDAEGKDIPVSRGGYTHF